MLRTLRVQDLAIIEELELTLEPGLNVITGETGAGKSILLQALDVALGGRPDADLVRTGAEEGVVEALFTRYVDNPRLLPADTLHRVETEGLHRTVADYIAGMTDRFANEEYQRLWDPTVRV